MTSEPIISRDRGTSFSKLEVQILPETCCESVSFSVVHVQNIFSIVFVSSLLSANHLQGWSRSAENPLPAHTGQTEEEDSEGESLKYTVYDITAAHCIHCSMIPVVKDFCADSIMSCWTCSVYMKLSVVRGASPRTLCSFTSHTESKNTSVTYWRGRRKEVITDELEGVVCGDIYTNELIAGDELLMCCKRRLWLKRSCWRPTVKVTTRRPSCSSWMSLLCCAETSTPSTPCSSVMWTTTGTIERKISFYFWGGGFRFANISLFSLLFPELYAPILYVLSFNIVVSCTDVTQLNITQ